MYHSYIIQMMAPIIITSKVMHNAILRHIRNSLKVGDDSVVVHSLYFVAPIVCGGLMLCP